MSEWTPTASRQILEDRAAVLKVLRLFFEERGVLEVTTPIISHAANTEPAIESIPAGYTSVGSGEEQRCFLHTSPEFPMKRLLAAGIGPIYQLCRVFRNGERGRYHNPEFSLLEWYRPGFDHHMLMDEVEALAKRLLPAVSGYQRYAYHQLFSEHVGLELEYATEDKLLTKARESGIVVPSKYESVWLEEVLFEHYVVPELARKGAVFVYDYPPQQASLARLSGTSPVVAERFELYVDGIELANGFHELTAAGEQRARFEEDNRRRRSQGLEEMPLDEHFLDALEFGLPECAGVALGLDRLLMIRNRCDHIDEVIAFPFSRA